AAPTEPPLPSLSSSFTLTVHAPIAPTSASVVAQPTRLSVIVTTSRALYASLPAFFPDRGGPSSTTERRARTGLVFGRLPGRCGPGFGRTEARPVARRGTAARRASRGHG